MAEGDEIVAHDVAFYVEGDRLETPLPLGSSGDCWEVRFLDEDGDEIVGLHIEHEATLTFAPAGFANPDPETELAGFKFDIGVPGPPDESGTVTVTLLHNGHAEDQTFGPFNVRTSADGRECF